MKDKEKQILAITQDLSDCLEYDIEDSSVVDTYDTAYKLANKGWVKLSENNVVLLKSEYDKLQTENKRLFYQNCNLKIENKNLKEDLDIEVLKSKETAEKIIVKIKQFLSSVETMVGDDKYSLYPEIGYKCSEVDDFLDEFEK